MPRMTIRSLNTQNNRRIKLIKTATSVVDIGQQQGAVVNQSDYVGICLAPKSGQISCEGAIEYAYFGELVPENMTKAEYDAINQDPDLQYVYTLDGIEVDYLTFSQHVTVESILDPTVDQLIPIEMIPEGWKDVVDLNWGVMAKFIARTEENNRIKVGYNKDIPLKPMFWGNPTAADNQACLAPKTIPIGCAGATPTADTGGIWGNVTMTVNGIPHEAVMPIPDLLYIDNHGEELHNTFKNLSDQYLRVHITATELNQADHGWNENQNPTRTVDFNTGTIDFCLAPAGCEPTEFTMVENNLFEGGSVRLDYVIDAPNHGISNVSKRFSMTDIAQGAWLSDMVREVVTQIQEDHPFIEFRNDTGSVIANFDFWTFNSSERQTFRLAGATNALSSDPITIKFVKNGLNDDLFPRLFPDAAADGITEYSVHSCGTMEWPGI